MKYNPTQSHPKRRTLRLFTLASCLLFLGGLSAARAGEVFSSDFSKGTFDALGWAVKGDWSIMDYADKKPDLAKNPGPVAVFAANGKTSGSLTKKFDATAGSGALTLTFDAGFGWGNKSHVQKFQVMLLDADGNGYVFDVHRTKATWGAQWENVTKNGYNDPLHWAHTPIDTTQEAVVNGAGLRTFTVTRGATGNWTFNGDGWTGGPLTFTDATTTSFSQVVLCGFPNTDEIVFGKVKLETSAAK